jgi:ERCC4-type nuclease
MERFKDQFKAIERRTLKTGDYSIEGYTEKVTIERKSLSDLVSTVIHNRGRFIRELSRMQTYGYAAIVIEASLTDVGRPYPFSQANPRAVLGSLQSFALIYGVHIVFADDRVHAEQWVADTLFKAYKLFEEEAKTRG